MVTNMLINFESQQAADMSRIEYQTDINAPVDRVYEYYTNSGNIKKGLA
jgi:hypothetical protein